MKIWILEKKKDFNAYTSTRFKEVAIKMNIELKLVAPEELDIIVTGEGKNLALQDIRFSRTINRIQQAMIMELNKIVIIHLYLLHR